MIPEGISEREWVAFGRRIVGATISKGWEAVPDLMAKTVLEPMTKVCGTPMYELALLKGEDGGWTEPLPEHLVTVAGQYEERWGPNPYVV